MLIQQFSSRGTHWRILIWTFVFDRDYATNVRFAFDRIQTRVCTFRTSLDSAYRWPAYSGLVSKVQPPHRHVGIVVVVVVVVVNIRAYRVCTYTALRSAIRVHVRM